jgi:protein-L-isoaspartate(D-aspartate) O-methyltransferase
MVSFVNISIDIMDDNADSRNNEMITYLIDAGILKSDNIIEAFKKAPRRLFIPKEHEDIAYRDIPVPIIKNTTISQPSTVAFMLEKLQPRTGEKILEIGAGSGYQASLLGYCVGDTGKVIALEIDPDVSNFAIGKIRLTNQKNVEIVSIDGSEGYEKEAPYDKIIVTAGMPSVSPKLKSQLRIGGRLIAPVGTSYEQEMFAIDRVAKDKFMEENLGLFQFVPLRGKAGFNEKGGT